MKDYYMMLDVPRSATQEDIKKAYRKKAMAFHPDRDPEGKFADRFQAMKDAYETLSDREKRAEYDQSWSSSLLENPQETATAMWQQYIQEVLQHV